MAEATMAIVRGVHKEVDVMKIEILNSDVGKPVYALGELKWGAFRDVEERIKKYWLWGPLKPYAAYFFGAFKNLSWECSAQFRYSLPCDGCNKCFGKKEVSSSKPISNQNSRWWHVFIPRAKPDAIGITRFKNFLVVYSLNLINYR